MYYYVLEAPSSRAVRQSYQRLRDILTNLSIVGEIVTASPARTPAELAYMGISKGYSTIVAVGGDSHINEVAMLTLGRATLGIIPVNASPLVAAIIGVSDMRQAAESLKYRKISVQDTVIVEPDISLFLDGVISSEKLAKVSIVIDNKLRAHAYFNELVVTRSLELKVRSQYVSERRKLLGLFTVGGQTLSSESYFHGKVIRVHTDPALPLVIGDQPVTKTPLQLRLLPQSLKVITKRGTLLE